MCKYLQHLIANKTEPASVREDSVYRSAMPSLPSDDQEEVGKDSSQDQTGFIN